MRLIKVETKGFKSFADKTILSFDGGVVGIVGPNGSGKSNINDAIKWVLGEQSIKSLRGDSSDDIIFSGSKTVQSMNKAEVSLTFDNSENKNSLPHKKIIITRMIVRGIGGNKYFINGEPARLKEIKEIAMESGIGKSSLAIISQGTIQNIAQATPEERRGIFEEAAGISKYKKRKKDAMTKLEKTSETLGKVSLVIKELDKQINPLKKQAEKAKLFLSKKEELKSIELGLIAADINFFSSKLKELNYELKDKLENKEDLQGRVSEYNRDIKNKTNEKFTIENELISLNRNLKEVLGNIRNVEISSSKIADRRKMIMEGQIKSSDENRLQAIKEELESISSKINHYQSWKENSLKDIDLKKEGVNKNNRKISELNYSISKKKNEISQIKTRLEIFLSQKNNNSQLFRGSKIIIENSKLFPGFVGMVMNLIKVPEVYNTVIETVLSNSLQHIVVNSSDDAVQCVKFLNNNNGGRATFIPLRTIRPKFIRSELLSIIQNEDGFVGIASELIQTHLNHDILKKFLLGNVIVSKDIDSANKISNKINNLLMVVTLDGNIIRAGGVITGGQKNKSRIVLDMDNQIKKLQDIVPNLDAELNKMNEEFTLLNKNVSEDSSFISELNIETAKVIEKINILNDQFSPLKNQYESETNKKFVVNEEKIKIDNIELLKSEKSFIESKIKSKETLLIDLNNSISNATLIKSEMETSLNKIIDSSSTQLNEKNKAEYILDNQKQRLLGEYELTSEAVIGKYNLSIDVDDARDIVSNLRSDIRQIGNVNIDSIEKYDEVNKRYKKLTESKKELMEAKEIIISAIDNMDEIIVSKLDETFQLVNKEMNNIFKTMFGGGLAMVKYSDPSSLLTTGIEVIAQPPGKTVKNLKLLSGGEKAIVAITLLFAILKSKPIPLCILDEVEAALDDANVIRYATYLQELKNQTQFIVVTHRVGTMSRVDHLFGATMQTRGVTSFFTVKLSEAKKLLD